MGPYAPTTCREGRRVLNAVQQEKVRNECRRTAQLRELSCFHLLYLSELHLERLIFSFEDNKGLEGDRVPASHSLEICFQLR